MRRREFSIECTTVLLAMWFIAPAGAQSPSVETAGSPERGESIFESCAACHGDQAQGNQKLDAPKLSGREAWYLIRQLEKFKDGIRGAHEDDLPGRQMGPMREVLAESSAINDVIAYIQNLPDTPPLPTVRGRAREYEWDSIYARTGSGDANKGKELYPVCGNCHGARGEGIEGLDAPKLSGREDWYLIRQLKYFRDGVRGGSDDRQGQGMALMVQIMGSDDQAIYDLVAYLGTL